MNDEALKLVWRMVLNCIAGYRDRNEKLYELYLRERHLYVTIREILEYKRERVA